MLVQTRVVEKITVQLRVMKHQLICKRKRSVEKKSYRIIVKTNFQICSTRVEVQGKVITKKIQVDSDRRHFVYDSLHVFDKIG